MTPMLGIMASSRLSTLTYSQTVLADNPLSFWLFNETSGTSATDQGTANLALTYTNSPTLNQSTSLTGIPVAVSFDGTNDYAVRANNASYNISPNGTWSIEFWVKPNNTSSNSLWTVRPSSYAGADGVLANFYMDIADGKVSAYVGNSAGSGYVVVTSTASINNNAFHQIVLTATSGGNLVLYVDKVNNASTSSARAVNTTSKSITVAGNPISGTVSQFSKGLFTANSFYTTALSSGRVTAHYDAGV